MVYSPRKQIVEQPKAEPPPKLLSIDEAAEALRLSPWTIRLWTSKGKMPSVKLGSRRLIRECDIEQMIAENTTPARIK